jgi:spore maturation protein CgeB
MKILLSVPGHLRTVPMNRYVYQTLAEMGHDVKVFNFGVSGIYPRILKKISRACFYRNMNARLKRLADTFRPDLFFTIFGFDHDKAAVEYIRAKGAVTACWWLNDPFQIKRSLAQASSYDYYFTNSSFTLKEYAESGVKNAFFLPVGAFPAVHRKLPDTGKPYDICFAGDWGPMREKMLLSLAGDFRLSIWGPWGKKLDKSSMLRKYIVRDGFFTPEEMAVIFNSSKIILNIHSWFGNWNYGLNPRVFEANGCGTFQLSDFKEEIPELYEPDREIVLYNNMDELKERAAFYLGTDAGREDIAGQGYARTLKDHTYEHRLREMFDIMRMSG